MNTEQDLGAPDRQFSSRPVSAGWQVAWGVLLIISGLFAAAMPFVAAFATALLFAWVLIIGGAGELAYAVHTRAEHGFGWKLAAAVLTLALGVLILLAPLAGAASLGLLVGAFLFMGGVARIALAIRMKPAHGWGWVLFDGLLSIVVAGLIAAGWPEGSIVFIGLLTGLWLIWAGIWRVMLPFSRRT